MDSPAPRKEPPDHPPESRASGLSFRSPLRAPLHETPPHQPIRENQPHTPPDAKWSHFKPPHRGHRNPPLSTSSLRKATIACTSTSGVSCLHDRGRLERGWSASMPPSR